MAKPIFDRALARELPEELPLNEIACLACATRDNADGSQDKDRLRHIEGWLLNQIEWGRVTPTRTETLEVPVLSPVIGIIRTGRPTLQQDVSAKRRVASPTYTKTARYLSWQAVATLDGDRWDRNAQGVRAWVDYWSGVTRAMDPWFTQKGLAQQYPELFSTVLEKTIKRLAPGPIDGLKRKLGGSGKDFEYNLTGLSNLIKAKYPTFNQGDRATWGQVSVAKAPGQKPKNKIGKQAGDNSRDPLDMPNQMRRNMRST